MRIRTVCILLAAAFFSAGCATKYGVAAPPAADARQLVRETVLRAEGVPDTVREFSYSPEGKLLAEKISGAEGDVRETVIYGYTDGRKTERRVLNKNGGLTGRQTYSYTVKGLLETENYFDGEGRLLMSSRFAYNYWGDRTQWTTTAAAGGLVARTLYTYENGRPVTMIISGPAGENNMTVSVAYDAAGRKIRETYVNAAGSTEKEIAFTYDEEGRLASEETFSSFKTFPGKTVYEYSGGDVKPEKIYRYDNKGNPRETVIQEFALLEKNAAASL